MEFERRLVAHKHPETLLDLRGGLGERLDVDDPGAHILAFDRRLQRDQDVSALLKQVAELAQALLEQDRLITPGRVGELHDADLAAVPRPPLDSGR